MSAARLGLRDRAAKLVLARLARRSPRLWSRQARRSMDAARDTLASTSSGPTCKTLSKCGTRGRRAPARASLTGAGCLAHLVAGATRTWNRLVADGRGASKGRERYPKSGLPPRPGAGAWRSRKAVVIRLPSRMPRVAPGPTTPLFTRAREPVIERMRDVRCVRDIQAACEIAGWTTSPASKPPSSEAPDAAYRGPTTASGILDGARLECRRRRRVHGRQTVGRDGASGVAGDGAGPRLVAP